MSTETIELDVTTVEYKMAAEYHKALGSFPGMDSRCFHRIPKEAQHISVEVFSELMVKSDQLQAFFRGSHSPETITAYYYESRGAVRRRLGKQTAHQLLRDVEAPLRKRLIGAFTLLKEWHQVREDTKTRNNLAAVKKTIEQALKFSLNSEGSEAEVTPAVCTCGGRLYFYYQIKHSASLQAANLVESKLKVYCAKCDSHKEFSDEYTMESAGNGK